MGSQIQLHTGMALGGQLLADTAVPTLKTAMHNMTMNERVHRSPFPPCLVTACELSEEFPASIITVCIIMIVLAQK